MRGLLLALLALDFAGHHAGRGRASVRTAKTPAKTTVTTV